MIMIIIIIIGYEPTIEVTRNRSREGSDSTWTLHWTQGH